MIMSGFHHSIAIIALPNTDSVKFHKKFDYHHRGTLSKIGYKFEEEIDVAYFQLSFNT